MSILGRAFLATLLALVGFGVQAAPAGACDCARAPGPPPVLFRGRPVGPNPGAGVWTFDVTETIRGTVTQHQSVAIDTGDPGSCGLGRQLEPDATYEVGAVLREGVNGRPTLVVDLCNGSLRELPTAAASTTTTQVAAAEAPSEPARPPARWLWVVVGMVALAGTVAVAAGRWRRLR